MIKNRSSDWIEIQKLAKNGNPKAPSRIERTLEQWSALLDPEVYRITRNKGTERAFSSTMCSLFAPGKYACACCDTPLFDANNKFDSGSGWPSFTNPIAKDLIAYHTDSSFGMRRIEATCNICDAHLGHVFPDGPKPSGLRFCINAKALNKINE